MHPAQRRFLIRDQIVAAMVVNLVINGVIAWLSTLGRTHIPLWGLTGVAADTLATSFFLPLLLCLIDTPLVRKKLASGELSPLSTEWGTHPVLRWLPRSARVRAVRLGLFFLFTAAPLTIGAISGAGISQMTAAGFLVFKSLYATVLAGIVAAIVGYAALAERTAEPAQP